jgi:hypothetical protein
VNDKLPSGGKPISVTLRLPKLQVERSIKFFDLTYSFYEFVPHIIEA